MFSAWAAIVASRSGGVNLTRWLLTSGGEIARIAPLFGHHAALTRCGIILPEEASMYTLLSSLTLRRLLLEQVPAVGLSFIIAELFYKFHSFTLETGAFLATWYVVDVAIQFVANRLRAPQRSA